MEEEIPQKDMNATRHIPKLNSSNTTINIPSKVDKPTISTPPEVGISVKDHPVSSTTKPSPLKRIITFLFTFGTVLMICSQPSLAAEPCIGGNFVLINIDEITRVLRDTGQDQFTIRMENISIVMNVTVREYHRTVNSSDVNTAATAADVHDDDDDDDDEDEDDDGSGGYHQLVVSNQPIGSENPNLIAGDAINNNVSEEMEESSTSKRGLLVISGRQSLSNSSGSDASSYCPSPTESAISRYHESFSRSAGVSVLPNEVSKPILSEEGHQQMDQRHQTLISENRESTALQLFGSDYQFSENIESPIEDTTDSPGFMVITGQTLARDDRDAIYRVLGQRPQARTAVTLYHPTEENDGENGYRGALVVTERYRQPLRPAVGHQLLVTPHNPGTDPICPVNQPARLAAMAVSGSSQLSNPVISPVSSDRIMAANTNDTAVHQDNGSDIDI